MTPPLPDTDYLLDQLLGLLEIPSPTGYTDSVVRHVGQEQGRLGVDYELTRRGAIRATLPGRQRSPDRAIVGHLDTLGAMVRALKPDGRLAVAPINTWSSRFAEGARVTIFTDRGEAWRGSLLPLKASGHTYDREVDTQPVSWDQVELRVDADCCSADDARRLGIQVGDFVAVDPQPEITETGYIVSRHLDDKAGVAAMLAAARAVLKLGDPLPVDCHLLFTISEEVGSGASHVLHGDVAELVVVDNATPAPGQNSTERGVTVAMMDSHGPFDYHLTHRLLGLCEQHDIPHARDVFRYYRCDAAAAVDAGNDVRTALACFGADASHGYERTHVDSLAALARLLAAYVLSPPVAERDRERLGPLEGFTRQPSKAFDVPEPPRTTD